MRCIYLRAEPRVEPRIKGMDQPQMAVTTAPRRWLLSDPGDI